jgi:UDP-N-acetyl-D-mannosaminuronic acid dehydrogenase
MELGSVAIIGGCGHVGLPLAIALANEGTNVRALDIDLDKIALVNSGKMPFTENGAEEVLKKTLRDGSFSATNDKTIISNCEFVIVVVGTPVDEHLNPDPEAIVRAFSEWKEYLVPGQLIILRSTVYPGVTSRVEKWVNENAPGVQVAFCPERIAEGKAMTELYSLPQIIGARDETISIRAKKLFETIASSTIQTTPEEAELAKLFTNVWRYIKFAAVNQFYMMANDYGVEFENVRKAITFDYPRAQDMPSAGFAAGPCLFKDTMQLGAFSKNTFALGHAAMLVNEGLPLYVVDQMKKDFDLEHLTIGILGMAFKPDVDDERSSLSYKLRRILLFQAKEVLCSDPFVIDERFVSQEELITRSDIIVIGTPHSEYKKLKFEKPVVDVWNMTSSGVVI